MKKIKDLNSEEFLGLLVVLSPVLDRLMELEAVQLKRGIVVDEGLKLAMGESVLFEADLKAKLIDAGLNPKDIDMSKPYADMKKLLGDEKYNTIFTNQFFMDKARIDDNFNAQFNRATARDDATILKAVSSLPNKSLLQDAVAFLQSEPTQTAKTTQEAVTQAKEGKVDEAKGGTTIQTGMQATLLAINCIFKDEDFLNFLAFTGQAPTTDKK